MMPWDKNWTHNKEWKIILTITPFFVMWWQHGFHLQHLKLFLDDPFYISNSIVEAVLYRWSSYSGTMIVKAPWRLTVLQGMLVRNFDVRFLQLPWNFTALCWHLSLQDNRLVVFANYYDSISGRRSSQHDSMADIYISSHLVSMMVYIVVGIHWSLWIDQIDRMPFIIVMIVDCYIYNSCSIIIWGIWIDIFLLY